MPSGFNLKPGTLWRLLQRLDVLRRPERVEAFVQACECDSRPLRVGKSCLSSGSICAGCHAGGSQY